MSPTDADKLDEHEKRLNAVEMQCALDKQSRQQIHRSIENMNLTIAALNADFKAYVEDYHEDKTRLALVARNLENLAFALAAKADKDAVDTKADKAKVDAVDTKADMIAGQVKTQGDNQTWAMRSALAGLASAAIALIMSSIVFLRG